MVNYIKKMVLRKNLSAEINMSINRELEYKK